MPVSVHFWKVGHTGKQGTVLKSAFLCSNTLSGVRGTGQCWVPAGSSAPGGRHGGREGRSWSHGSDGKDPPGHEWSPGPTEMWEQENPACSFLLPLRAGAREGAAEITWEFI